MSAIFEQICSAGISEFFSLDTTAALFVVLFIHVSYKF